MYIIIIIVAILMLIARSLSSSQKSQNSSTQTFTRTVDGKVITYKKINGKWVIQNDQKLNNYSNKTILPYGDYYYDEECENGSKIEHSGSKAHFLEGDNTSNKPEAAFSNMETIFEGAENVNIFAQYDKDRERDQNKKDILRAIEYRKKDLQRNISERKQLAVKPVKEKNTAIGQKLRKEIKSNQVNFDRAILYKEILDVPVSMRKRGGH